MKKLIKNPILMFVLGAVIFGGVGTVLAYSYAASQIAYNPDNSAWKVNNVKDAIDSLYLSKTADNYSTKEQVIGTWINGKPLYQKTINGLSIKLSWQGSNYSFGDINTPISNVDYIIDAIGNGSNKALYHLNVDTTITSGKWRLFSYVGAVNVPLKNITFQYTKTTDIATK